MRLRTITGLLACVVVAFVAAATWEGSAMMGSYGDFPASGYYAACNSFTRNSTVEVTNLENGKKVTVMITRGLDTPGIFMMLSVEAANAIGLKTSRVIRVRASEPTGATELSPSTASPSSDPDYNPRLLALEELKRLGYDIEADESAAAAVQPTQPVATQPVATQPVQTAPVQTQPVDTPPAVAVQQPAETPVTEPASQVPAQTKPVEPEKADALARAGAKPKPTRTVLLPELPAPEAPAAEEPPAAQVQDTPPLAAVPVQTETVAERVPPPQPDQPRVSIAAESKPDMLGASTVLPTPTARASSQAQPPVVPGVGLASPVEPAKQSASSYVYASAGRQDSGADAELKEPEASERDRPVALDKSWLAARESELPIALNDPDVQAAERAEAYIRSFPRPVFGAMPAPAHDPELQPDQLPDVVLARLASPGAGAPDLSLPDGELVFTEDEGPTIVDLQSPSIAAAETTVELADASPNYETPVAVADAGLEPGDGSTAAELSEPGVAAEETPEPLATSSQEPVEGTPYTEPGQPDPSDPASAAKPVETASAAVQPAATTPSIQPAPTQPAATAAAPGEVILNFEPTSPRPPSAAMVQSGKAESAISAFLLKGKYYIQAAAFRTADAAKEAAVFLGGFDLLTVVEASSDKNGAVWRVFVGPLSRDESGVALVRVRALGYRDAFIKQGG